MSKVKELAKEALSGSVETAKAGVMGTFSAMLWKIGLTIVGVVLAITVITASGCIAVDKFSTEVSVEK